MLLRHFFYLFFMAGVGVGRVVLLQFSLWLGWGGWLYYSFLWLGWGGWFHYSFWGVGVQRVVLLVFLWLGVCVGVFFFFFLLVFMAGVVLQNSKESKLLETGLEK